MNRNRVSRGLFSVLLTVAAGICCAGELRLPLMSTVPVVDGKIEAAEWQGAARIDGFGWEGYLNPRRVAATLPLVALAARETGDPKYKAWVLNQLGEMVSWHPINRPGYSLYQPGLPPSPGFNDGNWLATGVGIREITSTLDTMGPDVPEDLRERLHGLLLSGEAGIRCRNI